MATVAKFIADTSALSRLHLTDVNAMLAPLIEAGIVATCAAIEFEILWSTRSPAEFEAVHDDRSIGYEWLATEDADWRRALEVQAEFWASVKMRTVPLPELLIAAVAERHRVTILHYDRDYDLINEITGQPTQWVVPQGSAP
jgi:predicted nucleic acid-binding protein